MEKYPTIIGGKEYEWGNYIFSVGRSIYIEFDSDYYISKVVTGKNINKRIKKEISKIPDPVSIDWFIKNGWDVPHEIIK